jgi:hypothetical protein
MTPPPSTRDTLLAALSSAHEGGKTYWESLSLPTFFAPLGPGAWSPAQHVRHLTKTARAVTRGLTLPRVVLWLMFRPARRASRGYAELLETYHAALAGGARASGPYIPEERPAPADPAAARAALLAADAAATSALIAALRRWPERAFDRYRLPHPALGKLTVREMLFFTVFHTRHHADVVRRRLAERA